MTEIERLAGIVRNVPQPGVDGLGGSGSFETTMAAIEAAQQELAEGQVRAILQAMREPSEGMLKAADATDDGYEYSHFEHEKTWQAMIDHILSEAP